MIPVALGLGGLIARVAAVAVIPRVVKAIIAVLSPPDQVPPEPVTLNAPPPESAPDPVRGGEKQSFRACRYRRSYPTNFVDPEGLDISFANTWGIGATEFAGLMHSFVDWVYQVSGLQLDIVGNSVRLSNRDVNFCGTSGSARQLIQQMLDSPQNVVLGLTNSHSLPGKSPGGAAAGIRAQGGFPHQIVFDVLANVNSLDSAIAGGQFVHEIAEAYAEAKGQAFSSAHRSAIASENSYLGDISASGLNRRGDSVLPAPNRGACIDYTTAKYKLYRGTTATFHQVIR